MFWASVIIAKIDNRSQSLREELVRLAIEMYMNDEVTLERAAEIAEIVSNRFHYRD